MDTDEEPSGLSLSQETKTGCVGGDATCIVVGLIRADVSWESIVTRHAHDVFSENRDDGEDVSADLPKRRGRPRTRGKKPKKVSLTAPEAISRELAGLMEG
jgi:hypothetical protein